MEESSAGVDAGDAGRKALVESARLLNDSGDAMLQIKFPPEEDLAIDLDELSGEDRAILLSAIPFILGVKEAPKSLGELYAAFGNSTKVVANAIETAAQSKEAALPQFSTILADYVALGGAVSRIFC